MNDITLVFNELIQISQDILSLLEADDVDVPLIYKKENLRSEKLIFLFETFDHTHIQESTSSLEQIKALDSRIKIKTLENKKNISSSIIDLKNKKSATKIYKNI